MLAAGFVLLVLAANVLQLRARSAAARALGLREVGEGLGGTIDGRRVDVRRLHRVGQEDPEVVVRLTLTALTGDRWVRTRPARTLGDHPNVYIARGASLSKQIRAMYTLGWSPLRRPSARARDAPAAQNT